MFFKCALILVPNKDSAYKLYKGRTTPLKLPIDDRNELIAQYVFKILVYSDNN